LKQKHRFFSLADTKMSATTKAFKAPVVMVLALVAAVELLLATTSSTAISTDEL